ncbi:hypothetical protein [Streptomyces rubiginosohelvolus]|uniref:hypothetical protein n=1 Tax=Streptomyces rubiginosohelvolus TaxID=67362 RepID=UPI00386942F5|nr:hypothetical protein OG475_17910 [Streptomyces rubiginosohelvolus]
MPIYAGQTVTAGQLTRLQPVPYEATGTTNLNPIPVAEADVAGALLSIATTTANAFFVATATFSFDTLVTTSTFAEGRLRVDGVNASGAARWSGPVATDFGSAAQQWSGTLAAAGNHTFQLRAAANSGSDIQLLAAYTKLQVTIYEVV